MPLVFLIEWVGAELAAMMKQKRIGEKQMMMDYEYVHIVTLQ